MTPRASPRRASPPGTSWRAVTARRRRPAPPSGSPRPPAPAGPVGAGRAGAPLPAGPAERLARLPGVGATAGMVPTQVFLLDKGLTGWDAPWAAAGIAGADAGRTLDLGVSEGDVRAVRGTA